jgi:hypothetical protein
MGKADHSMRRAMDAVGRGVYDLVRECADLRGGVPNHLREHLRALPSGGIKIKRSPGCQSLKPGGGIQHIAVSVCP